MKLALRDSRLGPDDELRNMLVANHGVDKDLDIARIFQFLYYASSSQSSSRR